MERPLGSGVVRIARGEYAGVLPEDKHVFLVGDLQRPTRYPFIRDSRVELVLVSYEPGDDGTYHWHETVTEYELVVEGEIGYLEVATGATHWFGAAREVADDGTSGLGWVDLYDGASANDVGDDPRAERLLVEALELAGKERDLRLRAYTLTMQGRRHLLSDRLDEADCDLQEALEVVRSLDWTAFRPFPEALLAESVRRTGDLRRGQDLAAMRGVSDSGA